MTNSETCDVTEILDDVINAGDIARAGACVETFRFTATLLRALAVFHAEHFDDLAGARLLLDAAHAMAKHEATVV